MLQREIFYCTDFGPPKSGQLNTALVLTNTLRVIAYVHFGLRGRHFLPDSIWQLRARYAAPHE
jgi:hypothetical protein